MIDRDRFPVDPWRLVETRFSEEDTGLTETVFSYRGVGEALYTSFREKDYAVLQVLILAAAVIYVLINLLVDIAYALIDPRIRAS